MFNIKSIITKENLTQSMWNPFNYIPTSNSSTTLDSIAEIQFIAETNNKKTQEKYLIEEYENYHKKIKNLEIIVMQKVHNEEENARIVRIFSELVSSL